MKELGTFYKKSMVSSPAFCGLIVIFAVGLNSALACIVQFTHIPLYLDSVSIFTVAASIGTIPALITAALTNIILALAGKVKLPFIICNLLTALGAAWIFYRARGRALTLSDFLWAGILSALSNGIGGALIAGLLFGGATAAQIANLVLGIFVADGNLSLAVLTGSLLSNLIDKGVSAVLGFYLLQLLVKGNVRFNGSEKSDILSESNS
jgi:hypothetical protein